MMRKPVLLAALLLTATAATAQLPGLRKRGPVAPTSAAPALPLQGVDALRADFIAKVGSETVYFMNDTAVLGAQARTVLNAQAAWIRQHPGVLVRIEGHGDSGDTRDHALAMGARRAAEVRDYLVLIGAPAAQVSATSLGKERPGAPRAVTVLVR